MSRVFANGRSILHKGSGNTHTSAAPDVCNVPTPGGTVPTPFVNSAQDSMLTKGSKSVTINGYPVALTDSELSTSSGDEPGTAGGLISSKLKGKMAWGSGSVDVKIEGKGVVRFLDVTLHNGNTYNTAFISAGGTGLAYGDDAKCKACGKSPKNHRVLEMPEATALNEAVLIELMKRYHEQRPLLEGYVKLRLERVALDNKFNEENRALDAALGPKKKRVQELVSKLSSQGSEAHAVLKDELTSLQAEIKDTEQINKKSRAIRRQPMLEIEREMALINAQLEKMKPVLGEDEKTGTFTSGYMLGACICKCPKSPRRLVASSGKPTPGFREAVASTSFTLVESFQMTERQALRLKGMPRNKWECAAPKLLLEGGAGGHKVRTVSERFFAPFSEQLVKVPHRRSEKMRTQRVTMAFGHGESVPSCDTCQRLMPEMLCDNQKECA